MVNRRTTPGFPALLDRKNTAWCRHHGATQAYQLRNLRGIMGRTGAEDNIRFSHQRIQRTGVVESRSLGACLTGRTATRAEPVYRLAGIHHGAGVINWPAALGSAPNLPFNNHQSVIGRDPNRIGVVSKLKRSTLVF
jgi:hypothetical protein